MRVIKKNYCSLLSFVFIVGIPTILSSINIEKLGLQKIFIQNNTHQKIDITVQFLKECGSCKRMHKNKSSENKYSIMPYEKKHIQKNSNIIQTIQLSAGYLNIISNSFAQPLFSLDLEKQEDHFSPDFLINPKEFTLLEQGNKAYQASMPKNVSYTDFFFKIQNLYDKNGLSKMYSSKRSSMPKIPLKMHFIWFGSPLPDIFQKWQQEWQEKHPYWRVFLWDEALIKKQFSEGLFNQKIYNEALAMRDYATMSKIVRYEILNKFGGAFIEPNLKCFESLNPLHEFYDFYAGLGTLRSYGAISNSVIGARANHPILKACMEYIKESDRPHPDDSYPIGSWMMRHLSTAPLTHAVYKNIDQNNNCDIIFPRTFFDANTIKKQFFHKQKTHESPFTQLNHPLESFCSNGPFSTIKEREHEKATTCLDSSAAHDAAALEFISTNYPQTEKPIVIIIASYNNAEWFKANLTSVFMQKYTNYRVIYIDDASPDGTGNLVEQFIKNNGLKNKITLIKNQERAGGAAPNYYKATQLCQDEEIIVHLDGDDWFAHENVLAVLNKVYSNSDTWLTYGQFRYHSTNQAGYCREFPLNVVKNNSFRDYPWIVHHPRTFYAWLFKLIKIEDLQFKGKFIPGQFKGKFIPASWDTAHMFPLLEMAGERAKFIPHLLCIHNKTTSLNINKVTGELQAIFSAFNRIQPKYERLEKKPSLPLKK